jgi:hypothetical protein
MGFGTAQDILLALQIDNWGFTRRTRTSEVFYASVTYTGVASRDFEEGDTYGCGYDIDTNTVFYTINNQLAAYFSPGLIEIKEWQPIVTIDLHLPFDSAVLKTNFGYKPFQYDLSRRDYDTTGSSLAVPSTAIGSERI